MPQLTIRRLMLAVAAMALCLGLLVSGFAWLQKPHIGFLEVHITNQVIRTVKQINEFNLLYVFVLKCRVSATGQLRLESILAVE